MFLIFVNTYSKWIDVHITNCATASATTEKMRNTFATFGIPVIDNAFNFTIAEFEEFMKSMVGWVDSFSHIKSLYKILQAFPLQNYYWVVN